MKEPVDRDIMGIEEHRLRIPANVDKIASACEFVADVAQLAGLDDDAVYHCQLSVEEICTNIIEHGYGFDATDEVIDIVCTIKPNQFVIVIVDDAPAFNPLELPDPNPDTPLWEREGGGWGVYFVKKFMNSISYRYQNNRNQIILEKQR